MRTRNNRSAKPLLLSSLFTAVGLLALVGCTSDTTAPEPPAPNPTAETPVVPEPEVTSAPETPLTADGIWPLTGVPTDEVADRPALILKVEGSVQARPQDGLEYADTVYEVVVEGGITRFIAVYDSEIPETVLPIRSGRSTDVGIVLPYGGVFGYSGSNEIVVGQFRNAGLQSLTFDAGNAGFRRVAGRPAPHNVAADPAMLLSQANATRVAPVAPNQRFAASAAESSIASGQPVSRLSARMSNIQTTNWDWNAAGGVFLRSDGATPSMTAAGEQMAATNVVLLSVPLITGEDGNPEMVTTGSGDAVFATDGRYIEGTWSKPSESAPFRFLDASGNEVLFAPGSTWYQLVPTNSTWTIN